MGSPGPERQKLRPPRQISMSSLRSRMCSPIRSAPLPRWRAEFCCGQTHRSTVVRPTISQPSLSVGLSSPSPCTSSTRQVYSSRRRGVFDLLHARRAHRHVIPPSTRSSDWRYATARRRHDMRCSTVDASSFAVGCMPAFCISAPLRPRLNLRALRRQVWSREPHSPAARIGFCTKPSHVHVQRIFRHYLIMDCDGLPTGR
mmetsp:Transcript_33178/g.87173  ORF Transcript_33178/g.87173 Transcript_33178/m.87173 type:complete len:201 (-) Transcript_33178:92-694(-)